MSGLTGVNLFAADYHSTGGKIASLAQEGGQGTRAEHGSQSVNNLAQKDRLEQAEEVSINTGIQSKKAGSPTNIDGHAHTAAGSGASEVGQEADQAATADGASRSVNNQSEMALVDQAEKISTNLDVDVQATSPKSCGRATYVGYPWHGWRPCQGPPPYPSEGPDSILVNLEDHTATAALLSATGQDGDQLAKADHGSVSINNLRQEAATNQAEDVSVNADVQVHGRGTQLGGPVLVSANDHTASGSAVATSVQRGSQTAISDHGSLSVNNLSQCNFVHQNEKVGVNTNVVV